jgi:hypothetical protein
MKATTIIIAAILSLQVNVLFAGNYEESPTVNSALAPVTPGEATFEETTLTNAFTFKFSDLAPVTPGEADFSDVVPEKNIDLTILAPVTPAEADFTDSIEGQEVDFSALAPVTPAEADFE